MAEGPEFDARIERRAGHVVVVVRGELDMDSASPLRALLASEDAQGPVVVLDLRAVTFVDSSGLSVIVGEHQRAKAAEARVRSSVSPSPRVFGGGGRGAGTSVFLATRPAAVTRFPRSIRGRSAALRVKCGRRFGVTSAPGSKPCSARAPRRGTT